MAKNSPAPSTLVEYLYNKELVMTNNPPSTRIQPGEYGYPLKLKARYDNF
ncbi:hypothetical protein ZY54_004531, partial [Salmonella enterica subsp. enterica serovar Braenderup]|nr:hypothetical protein [Salmonella enterica subsp. enterica serovar Braenderup]EDY0538303.1 hypothetical protein [Salmonella enterica subsp. enterica serovar Bareilly]